MMILIAVIDDNRLLREALTEMLGREPGLTARAYSVLDLRALQELGPDIVLLDLGLSDEESLSLVAAMRRSLPSAKIIAMDILPADDEVEELRAAGVAALVQKDASFGELVRVLRVVAAGDHGIPAARHESILAHVAATRRNGTGPQVFEDVRMTPREREVVALIAEGLSNKEISVRLNIASHTVKSHVRNIMEKLALHTRLQIAAYTVREAQRPDSQRD